mmetsp:Transcript_56000/g.133431  ORF Transcript_56000/g.133431 Transcript_56000/m.133431 type:complete len:299 (+) Transcript_56000:73-969(+)
MLPTVSQWRWVAALVLSQHLVALARRPASYEEAATLELDVDSELPATVAAAELPGDPQPRRVSSFVAEQMIQPRATIDELVVSVFSQHEQALALISLAARTTEKFSEAVKDWLMQVLVLWLLYTAAGLLSIFICYRREDGFDEEDDKDEDDIGGPGPKGILHQGHFNCLSHSETCFWAIMCPSVRWADTVSATGLLGFWTAYSIFALLMLLNLLGHMSAFIGIFTTLLILYFRVGIRQRLAAPSTVLVCCKDFFFILMCPCCAIAQEARAVRRARLDGLLVGESVAVPPSQSPAAAES